MGFFERVFISKKKHWVFWRFFGGLLPRGILFAFCFVAFVTRYPFSVIDKCFDAAGASRVPEVPPPPGLVRRFSLFRVIGRDNDGTTDAERQRTRRVTTIEAARPWTTCSHVFQIVSLCVLD